MTTYILAISTLVVLNLVLLLLLRNSYSDNEHYRRMIDSLEEELNEEEMK